MEFRLCRAIRLRLVLPQGGSVSHARSWANREALPACDTYSPSLGGPSGIAAEAGLARIISFRQEPPSGPVWPDTTSECAKQQRPPRRPPPRWGGGGCTSRPLRGLWKGRFVSDEYFLETTEAGLSAVEAVQECERLAVVY